MARVFITGSADGLGLMAAQLLVKQGHQVVLHARNERRAQETLAAVPGAEMVLQADLASISETKQLAEDANHSGVYDAVIHNAGIGYREAGRGNTIDGLPPVFAVNTLAPYILTCLMHKPKRLIYLSSGLHRQGDPSLKDITWDDRKWSGYNAYADSKLHDLILAFAVARKWPDVLSNAIEPGWVATKMGGAGAPDSLEKGYETQAWLAVSNDEQAMVSGKYFYHKKLKDHHPAVSDVNIQELLLSQCQKISGISFPNA